ncbi:chaperonin 10-like protein [Limtongia smithiae]|uniref:chaperonin 10-like protein n=1 Tax=Limtongia smithiae TaxID=1125753 RepID=UPI0034CE5E0B
MSATQTIEASVLVGVKQLSVETREIGPPGDDEAQVVVKSTTLCGSDLHYYNHHRNGDFIVREPLSLGHESAGEVVAVGKNVTNVRPGDRVALEVGIACLTCEQCLAGRYNLCYNMQFRSSAKVYPHFQGTLQQRINHPARLCHKLGPGISYNAAALMEPLCVVVHAAKRAALEPGMKVLVFGAGAVGLLAGAMAKVAGATTIAITDVVPKRVEFALANGFATHGYVVPPRSGPPPANVEAKLEGAKTLADAITGIKEGEGSDDVLGQFDVVFECTGVESCVQSGIYATKAGGKLMFVGMGNPVQTLHIGSAALREVDLLGVFRYANAYPVAISLLQSGAIAPAAVEALVTHKFAGLREAGAAFELAGKMADADGKLVIKVVVTDE